MTKVSKASVHYRPAEFRDVRCGTCVMFHPDGTCDLVAGVIDAGHVCDRWQSRHPVPSGHARETAAARAGMQIARIFLAAQVAILQALAWWALKVVTGGLLAGLAARRLHAAVTLILAQAETLARQVLAGIGKDIRAAAEQAVRRELAGSPLLARAVAEVLSGLPAGEWRSLPLLLHRAALTAAGEVDGIFRQAVARAMAASPEDRLQAAQLALDELTGAGITGFTDSAGRNWDLVAYLEMATRTAASRMHLALQLAAMQAAGLDLVLIVHTGDTPPCPKCAPYVGQVLSMGELEAAQAEGLFHPACRCSAQPWSEGMDMPSSATLPPDVAAEYEAEQAQRRHERAMRRQKRLAAVTVTRKRIGRPR